MKLSALAALATAALLVSSCTQTADRARLDECRRTHCRLNVMLALNTDENGKLKTVRVIQSSGVTSEDQKIIGMAKRLFPKKIPKPRKNFTFRMPGQVKF